MVIYMVTIIDMVKINVAEAKAKLSEYLDRALAGEKIIICRHNDPIAELHPIAGTRTEPRPIGPLTGRPAFEVPATFFEPLPDEDLDAWEGLASYVVGRSKSAPHVAEHTPDSRERSPRRKRHS